MSGIGFGGPVRGLRKRLPDCGRAGGGGRTFSLAGQGNGANIGAGGGGQVLQPGSGPRDVQEVLSRAGGLVRRPPTGWEAGWVGGPKTGCPESRVLVPDGSLPRPRVWRAGALPGCGLG